jgi:hypothetical protein
VNAIKIKNRIGSFTIKQEKAAWILQKPRVIPANSSTIKLILKALSEIKVQTIHQHEPINFQSFSLDQPVLEIDLYTKLDEKIEINVGLINPINNTSYITVTGHNQIFQINILDRKLATLALSDFIDSKIFSMPINSVKNISLFHGNNIEAFNKIEKINDNWKFKKYKITDDTKTHKKIESIFRIKTHMIIDKKDDKLKTFIDNYLKNPQYRIIITQNNGVKTTYTITRVIKAISELKLENKQYFIITASDRPHPYVVNKAFLNNFIIRYSEIRN